jgi:hypothetical protein
LFKTYTLYLLSIDLILVTGTFSIITPMWDMQLVFPRLILLAILLYLPAEWDMLSLDYLLSIAQSLLFVSHILCLRFSKSFRLFL